VTEGDQALNARRDELRIGHPDLSISGHATLEPRSRNLFRMGSLPYSSGGHFTLRIG
jgi:hypothetical protein